jgi:O-antigen/teichoic acid export membrane protein
MNKFLNLNFKGDIIVYLTASVFNAGLSFVFTILLTYFLAPSEIGKIETFVSITSITTAIILFGSNTHLVKFYSEGKENHFQTIFNGITFNSILLTIIILSISLFFAFENFLLITGLLFSISTSFYTIIITSYQLEKKSITYAKTIITYGLINFALSLFFIFLYESGNARIGSIAITSISLFIYVYLRFDKFVVPRIKIDKSFYSIGYILFFSQVFSWIIEKSDRVLITEFLNTAETGKYGIGYQFGMIVLMVQVAISRAWMPRIIENFKLKKIKKIKIDMLKISFLLLALGLLISVFSYFFITLFLNEEYLISATIAIIVSFGYILDGIWKLYNSILVYFNNYFSTLISVFFAGLTNLSLNYLFLEEYGIVAAAISTLFSFFIGLLISIFLVHFKFKFLSNEQ